MPVGKVSHAAELRKTIGSLYMDEELFDVSIRVEDEVFPAHRVILSAQSKYFKQLFYGKKKTEVTLNNTPAEVFRDILAYFYTGDLDLQNPAEEYVSTVLRLAKQYQLHALQRDVVDDMCAKLLVDEPLSSADLELYDLEADNLLKTDLFLSLDAKRVQELLSRDTFHVDREIDVFRAGICWSKARPAEEKKDVMDTVRLPCIEHTDLISEVSPMGVYSGDDLIKAMTEQLTPAKLKRRIPKATTLPEENVALSDLGAEVITGTDIEYFLQDAEESKDFLSHKIQPWKDQTGIVVKLGSVYRINHIELSLCDKDQQSVSYYVETRTQGEGPWMRIVDFTEYKCGWKQQLYFDPLAVKYIKLVGTSSTGDDVFAVKSLRCFYMTVSPNATRDIQEPMGNQTLETEGAIIMSGMNSCKTMSMLDGNAENNGHYTQCPVGQCIKVCLPQPVRVGSIRFRLMEGQSFMYKVDISMNDLTWTEVANKQQNWCNSWQKVEFEKQTLTHIRFTGRDQPGTYLRIVHLECPDSTLKPPTQ